ncbi:Protein roadkill like protein [Argiope bruennichi]|uniref:Protein roadkill like protein n=1 Tax=Argiope bruennichi TaxID=94029 RepID=A0A8T0EDL2_ARGBR|nr:Protein roadkill like protein [Argiope bruennichi]
MAKKDAEIGSDIGEFGIQIIKNSRQIITEIRHISKVPLNALLISPGFHLASNCTANILFQKASKELFVCICNKSDAEIKIRRTIILSDCHHRKLHEERDGKIFLLEKDKAVDILGRLNDRRSFDSLPSDLLIIDIWIHIKEIVRKGLNLFVCDADPGKKLKEDFKTMLVNPINSDVTLQVGSKRIPAHWSILCSRSPYFKRMFDSGMLKRVQTSITITDFPLCTMKALVEFLYTANFNQKDDLQELFDLYQAANKYEVMDLRTLCGSRIINNATTDNVCKILQLAHRLNDKALKTQAMELIKLHSDDVFQTEGWKNFEANEPLVAEVFNFCLQKN